MMQLKAICTVLLHGWEFEAAQPLDSYRNDHSKMVVQLQQPCRVRYRRRAGSSSASGRSWSTGTCAGATQPARARHPRFSVSKKGELTVLQPEPPESQHAAVELAVKYCPTHALSIEED